MARRTSSSPPWLQVDFIPRRRPVPVLAWCLLAAGVGTAAVTAVDWHAAGQAHDDAAQMLAQWHLAQSHAQRPNPSRPDRVEAAVPPALLKLQVAQARQAAQLLGQRWGDLFSTLESVVPTSLQWQRVQVSAPSGEGQSPGEVQLTGLVPDRAQALALVDALAGPAGWPSVSLSQLAPAGDGALLRFELRARWAEGAP